MSSRWLKPFRRNGSTTSRRASACKKLLIAACALCVLIGSLWPIAATFLIQSILREARANGAKIAWQGISAGYLSASAETLEVWVPGPPMHVPVLGRQVKLASPAVKIELQNTQVVVPWNSLLRLSPEVVFSSHLYGGSVNARIQDILSSKIAATVDVQNLAIDRHPLLRALGFAGGNVSFRADHVLFLRQNFTLTNAAVSLLVTNLELPPRPEVKMFLKTDSILVTSLNAEALVNGPAVTVKSLSLDSSLGRATGGASLIFPQEAGNRGQFSLTSMVRVADGKQEVLGSYLPLISGGALDANDSDFMLQASSAPCVSHTPALKLLGECIAVTLSRQK